MKRLATNKSVYHGTVSIYKNEILSQGINPTDGGQGDGAYTTTDYQEAVKYAMDRSCALVSYRGDNPHKTYPIVIECFVDSKNCQQAFNGKWNISQNGIPVDNIISVIDLDSSPKWIKLIELYEKDPQSNEFNEYAYTLMNVL